MKRTLPNLLSGSRLVLALVMVVLAWVTDSRAAFLTLLVAALVTDGLDGYFARRWHVESDFGRRLDSWGDYVLTAAALAGIWRLWPALVREEWPWFLTTLIGYFILLAYGLIRWRRVLGYHTRMAKTMVVVMPVTVAVLLLGGTDALFHVAVILQVACGLEELAIAFVLPGYSGHMPSLWHALRRRRVEHSAGVGTSHHP